jgi:hypothetical protein
MDLVLKWEKKIESPKSLSEVLRISEGGQPNGFSFLAFRQVPSSWNRFRNIIVLLIYLFNDNAF